MSLPAERCLPVPDVSGKLAALVDVSMLEQQIAFRLYVGWDPVDPQHCNKYQ